MLDNIIVKYDAGEGTAKWVSKKRVASVTATWKPRHGVLVMRKGLPSIEAAQQWISEQAGEAGQ